MYIYKVTAFLLSVQDVNSMAKKCIYLLSDEVIHKEFSIRAYNKAKEFEVDKIVPMYEAFYNETIDNSQ